MLLIIMHAQTSAIESGVAQSTYLFVKDVRLLRCHTQ